MPFTLNCVGLMYSDCYYHGGVLGSPLDICNVFIFDS